VTAGRSPALAVRAIERADEAAWRELWRGYLAFYETTRPEPIYRATFDRLTDPPSPTTRA
jgi:hypothetical protein